MLRGGKYLATAPVDSEIAAQPSPHGLPNIFFQAEDGIRYLTVTGVQTCALPISGGFGDALHVLGRVNTDELLGARGPSRDRLEPRPRTGLEELADGAQPVGTLRMPGAGVVSRSEERRVGKECRSRWSPDH